MDTKSCVRTLKMTLDEWHALERLALQFSCQYRDGIRRGEPSWLTLIRMIAQGKLQVTWPEAQRRHLERIDAAIAHNEREAKMPTIHGAYEQLNILDAEPA